MQPTVSVCIPAYRAERHIGETIRSVLASTFEDFEVVVTDDASPDDTVEVVNGFSDARVRLERNPANLGIAGNWDRSVSLARGRYVKVLCDDDLIYPDCLSRQVAGLDDHPEVALVSGQRDIISEDGQILIPERGLGRLEGLVDGQRAVRATVRSGTNLFGEPLCVMMRREQMAVCGGFSGGRPYMIDLDYWCRMLKLGPLWAQRGTVGAFRVVSTSLSVQLRGRQSREAVSLFRELREGTDGVSRLDLAEGAARAISMNALRSVGYQALQLRRRVRGAR